MAERRGGPKAAKPEVWVHLSEHEYFTLKSGDFRLVVGDYDQEGVVRTESAPLFLKVRHHEVENPKAHYASSGLPGYRTPTLACSYKTSSASDFESRPELRKQILGFLAGKLIPFVKKHRAVYVKDAVGGGGTHTIRLFVKSGVLMVQTPDKLLALRLTGDRLHGKALGLKAHIARSSVLDERAAHEGVAVAKLSMLADPQTLDACGKILSVWLPQGFVAQKEIPHLQISGKPVELRFFVQRAGGYAVTDHYAKIGGKTFVSNISQGGKIRDSLGALVDALEQAYPEKPRNARTKIALRFIKKAEAMAERLMNENPAYQRPMQVYETALGANLVVPPILSTVDIIAEVTKRGIRPVVMEHHASGDFGMIADVNSGAIPRKRFARMMQLHKANIEEIVRAARKKLGD